MIFMATCESANFSFMAFGSTYEKARETMVKTLRKHARQYDISKDWYKDHCICINKISLGCGYRDGGLMISP
jgi:hypothetical protein